MLKSTHRWSSACLVLCSLTLCLWLVGCSSDDGSSSSENGSGTSSNGGDQDDTTTDNTSTDGDGGETTDSGSGSGSAATGWGHLKGRFVFGGDAPEQTPLKITKDAEVCGKHPVLDETLVVNTENKGVANVVVSLYVGRNDTAAPVHESYAASAKSNVKLDNKQCRFDPHVAVMRTSQTLLLGNSDPVGHNSMIEMLANTSVNYTVPANSEMKQTFTSSERLPAKVSCSVHSWMTGWLIVRDDPYAIVTDADGNFEIQNLPAGTWSFQAWQEKAGSLSKVTVGGTETDWARGRFETTIEDGKTQDMGDIVIQPAAFEK